MQHRQCLASTVFVHCCFDCRQNDTILSALYSCEAVVMCCHILNLFSHLLSHPLTLHVNHVGVGVCFAFYCVDYFDDDEFA